MPNDSYLESLQSFADKMRDLLAPVDFDTAIQEIWGETHWNIRDFLWMMVAISNKHFAVDESKLDELEDADYRKIEKQLYDNFDEYFSALKLEIREDRIRLVDGMEQEPDKPSYLPWRLGLFYNFKQFLSAGIGEKLRRLNKDYVLLSKYIFPDEAVNFARENGVIIPEKTSIPPENAQALPLESSKAERIREIIKKICTTDRKNPGAKGLWDPRDEVLYDGIDFMIDTVDLGECKCRHEKLASVVFHKGTDRTGTPFGKLNKERFGLETKFKEAAFWVVPPERRFGYKIDETLIYDKNACNCTIPSHVSFFNPSRKNAKNPTTK